MCIQILKGVRSEHKLINLLILVRLPSPRRPSSRPPNGYIFIYMITGVVAYFFELKHVLRDNFDIINLHSICKPESF